MIYKNKDHVRMIKEAWKLFKSGEMEQRDLENLIDYCDKHEEKDRIGDALCKSWEKRLHDLTRKGKEYTVAELEDFKIKFEQAIPKDCFVRSFVGHQIEYRIKKLSDDVS